MGPGTTFYPAQHAQPDILLQVFGLVAADESLRQRTHEVALREQFLQQQFGRRCHLPR